MNTNTLKRFAREARIKLLDQVERKMEFVLSQDTAGLRGKEKEIAQLRKKIGQVGRKQLVENVAYTWFNRLMALRFMDTNGYTIPKVVTPLEGMSNPEILQNALAGHTEPELRLDRKRLDDLLDGRTATADAHTEAYKMLLIAVCNQLSLVMPFMFERISDYTELLLPDDLLSEYSIVADIRNGMTDEDCKQEEIIGWLYQFYISDKKDGVFDGLKKNIKITPENIPAATQLFTPRWIVRYMVENTLGKLWLTLKPDSKLRKHMPYYIEAPEGNAPAPLPEGINGVTNITFLDPCQGSGHILVYAFDLFTKIYEEEGYNINEIPALILQNNLFGIDIDERAAQLAAFALTMKARAYYTRFLRKPVQPHVITLENVTEDTISQAIKLPITINEKIIFTHNELSLYQLTQADNFGSLITIEPEEIKAIEIKEGDLFLQEQPLKLKLQAEFLSKKYHCVVTNPPYMGGGGMNDKLKIYLDKCYPNSRADLMTCFMDRAVGFNYANGYWGMINLPSWMFLGTFEKFRRKLIINSKLDSMLHLGRGIFGSDFGSVALTLQNRASLNNEKGVYRRLFKEHVQVRSVEVIKQLFFDSSYGYFESDQENFKKIPASPMAYWSSKNDIRIFSDEKLLNEFADPRQGLATGDNGQFLRFFWEVPTKKIGMNHKWVFCSKGGNFRRWYGNVDLVLNWENNGFEIKNFKTEDGKLRSVLRNQSYYFTKEALTWSTLSSSKASFRIFEKEWLFESKGSVCFPKDDEDLYQIIAYLNSNLVNHFLKVLSPTLDFHEGPMGKVPFIKNADIGLKQKVIECINIAKNDWNTRETSWDFQQNELIKQKESSLNISIEAYKSYWSEKFYELHQSEEEINKLFIGIYGLNGEIIPDVPLKEITILQEEAQIVENKLEIQSIPVILQLLSYAIGNLFGRYNLDKPGLILANAGDTLQDFLQQIPNPTFMPDEDNIIPVLDGEWFNDDVVDRFKTFLKAAFGEENFEENLRFIEDTLGKDVRKYFIKDFYNDHIKRYKKRPIYWMFSSTKGHFKALIYMHRYQPDLCSKLLNDYLQAFITKLEAARQTQTQLSLREDIVPREKIAAQREIDKIDIMLKDCREYEKTLFTLATQKISMDLDDGVKVNYQKLKQVLIPIKGLEKEEE